MKCAQRQSHQMSAARIDVVAPGNLTLSEFPSPATTSGSSCGSTDNEFSSAPKLHQLLTPGLLQAFSLRILYSLQDAHHVC